MAWHGVSASLGSPMVETVFSPPMHKRQPFGDATNVNRAAAPAQKAAPKKAVVPAASLSEAAEHEDIWNAWSERDDAMSPETAAAVEKYTEESWDLWEGASPSGAKGLSPATAEPIGTLVSRAALLGAYVLIVAVAIGWTFFPAPREPALPTAPAMESRVRVLLDEWTF